MLLWRKFTFNEETFANEEKFRYTKDNCIEKAVEDGQFEKKALKKQNSTSALGAGSFAKLFRYAKVSEVFLTTFGCICGIITGMGLPISLIFSGSLTDAFVYHRLNCSAEKPCGDVENLNYEISIYGIRLGCVGILQIILSYLMIMSLNVAARRQIIRIQCLFFKRLLRQDMVWFDVNSTSSFSIKILQQFIKIQDGLGEKLGIGAACLSNYVASVVIALTFGWKLASVVLLLSSVLFITTISISKVQSNLFADEIIACGEASLVVEETVTFISTVVAYGGEESAAKKYESKLSNACKTAKRKELINAIGHGLSWFINYANYSLAFWYGINLVIESKGQTSPEYLPSDLIIVLFSSILGSMSLCQIGPYVEAILTASSAIKAMDHVIERIPLIDVSSTKGRTLPSVKGAIQFRGVYFSYPSRPNTPVLNDINLYIEPGETVAIVGGIGSGKSTLLWLLFRFYDPTQGSIFLDGHDIRRLNLQWIRKQIGVITQEPTLFSMTIQENIELGSDCQLTSDDVKNAARTAIAHNFISSLPQQYSTPVGERGTQLSGGQKQRIAIARALVKKPKIILFDEATSALDGKTEASFLEELVEVYKGVTKILITHRLSTVQRVDKIIVLHNGRILGIGTHNELFANCAVYKKLIQPEIQLQDLTLSNENVTRFDEEVSSPVKTPQNKSRVQKTVNSPRELCSRIIKEGSTDWFINLLGCIGAVCFGFTIPSYAIIFGELIRVLSMEKPEDAMEEAAFYSCLFLALGVLAGLSAFLQTYMFSLGGLKLMMRLRKKLFRSILEKEIGWFDDRKNSPGNLSVILSSDISKMQDVFGLGMGIFLQTIFSLILSLGLAAWLVWKQTLVSFILIPILFCGLYLERKTDKKLESSDTEAFKIAREAINSIKTVATLSQENKFYQLYVQHLYHSEKFFARQTRIRGVMFGFSQGIASLSYALCLWYGGYLVVHEQALYENVLKVGELLILGTIILAQNVAVLPNYNEALAAALRVFSILDTERSIQKNGIIENLKKLDIEFNHVSFTYPNRLNTVLSDFCCKVKSGETLALIGFSGSGKSTCFSLLERFYDPNEGSVLVGNKAVSDLNKSWFRSQVSLVTQEPVLFNCSIFENIAFGTKTHRTSLKQVIAAAKTVKIHDFITTLPDGYSTILGSSGIQLSGGQKQKIAIARALIRNPKILLLDEVTSALDNESEKILIQTLANELKGKTCIIISHRMSTVNLADSIIVLNGGKTVEEGRREVLIHKQRLLPTT